MPPHLRKLTIALALPALLIGCAPINSPAPIAAEALCRSWEHQQIRKADRLTESTAAQIEGNNAARPAWGCAPGENRAKARG